MTNAFSSATGLVHTQTLTGLGEGTYNYYARCADPYGNTNTNDFTISFTVDVTPPTTNAVGNSGGLSYTFDTWTSSTVQVTLTCSDSGSGCLTRLYCTDTTNTCSPTTTYSTSLNISAEGITYVRYRSTDKVYNQETIQTRIIKIDKTKPSTIDDYVTKNDAWQNSDQTITLTPQDAGSSGLQWTKYCIDTANNCDPVAGTSYTIPVIIIDNGVRYFRYASEDNAGNLQTTVIRIVKIDEVKPVAGTYTINGKSTGPIYTKGELTHSWSGFSDAESGLYSFEIWRAPFSSADCNGQILTGCQWLLHRANTTHPATGIIIDAVTSDYWYGWHSSDKVGNYITEGTLIKVVFDNTPPTFTIQYYSDTSLTNSLGNNPRLKAGTYYIKIFASEILTATPQITINAEGKANDVNNVQTTLVSGNDYKYTRNIAKDIAASGAMLEDISITGTDLAGNVASSVNPADETSKAAYTDTTLPTSAVSHSPEIITEETDVTIGAESTDSGGIADVKIFVDDNNVPKQTCTNSPCLYTSKYTGTRHDYFAKARDKAGNEQTSTTQTFRVLSTESIALKKGWNLASIPYKTFNIASTTCDGVKNFYHYNPPSTQKWNVVRDAKNLEGGKGYWVYSEKDCVIKIIGQQEVLGNDIQLQNGWNHIGSAANEPDFNSIRGGCTIERILTFDPIINNWKVISSIDKLEKFKAFFIRANC